MTIQLNRDQDTAVLLFDARFDFATHRVLRQRLDEIFDDQGLRKVVFDLANVTHIDSAALGMLLIARERCQAGGLSLSIRNARRSVRDVFNVAKFDTLFAIE